MPVEIVVNGRSSRQRLLADGTMRTLTFDVAIDRSSWIAARSCRRRTPTRSSRWSAASRFAPSRRSAEWCLNAVNQCWTQKSPRIRASGELEDARKAYEQAYRQRLAGAPLTSPKAGATECARSPSGLLKDDDGHAPIAMSPSAFRLRLAEVGPDNDALVYGDGGPRWTFAQLEVEAREIARGLLALGVKPGERVAGPGDQRSGMGRAAICASQDRRDSGHGQHRAPGARRSTTCSGSEEPERSSRFAAFEMSTIYRCSATSAHSVTAVRRPRTHHLYGADPPPGTVPTTSCSTASQRASEDQLSAQERPHARYRHQHARHLRYDRISEGRPALQPEHRQQRLLARRRPGLHAAGSSVPVRPALSLLWLCDRGVGAFTHGACSCTAEFFEPRKVLETVARERCTALYGVRRCSSLSWSIQTSRH